MKGFGATLLDLIKKAERNEACCLDFLTSVSTISSITGNGTTTSPLSLINDKSNPGSYMYYGTNDTGNKGWLNSPVIFNGGAAFIGGTLGVSAFPGWPYNSDFTQSVLGIYGVTPYIDVLIDTNSSFGIGGIAFKSLNPAIPYIAPSRVGANTFAAIEANAFSAGGSQPYTTTIEFYLGNTGATDVMTPLTVGNLGNHFYGFRNQITVDAHYRLFVGNKIVGNNPNFNFSNVLSTFAVDANNIPFTFFNYPNKATLDPTDQIMILDRNGQQWMVTLSALKVALAAAP